MASRHVSYFILSNDTSRQCAFPVTFICRENYIFFSLAYIMLHSPRWTPIGVLHPSRSATCMWTSIVRCRSCEPQLLLREPHLFNLARSFGATYKAEPHPTENEALNIWYLLLASLGSFRFKFWTLVFVFLRMHVNARSE